MVLYNLDDLFRNFVPFKQSWTNKLKNEILLTKNS